MPPSRRHSFCVTYVELADVTAPTGPTALGDVTVTPRDNPWTTTVAQGSAVLRKSPETVRRWCMAGVLRARKFGGQWMIHTPALAAALADPDWPPPEMTS